MTYEFIHTEVRDRVALITLNRPKQLNALNAKLMQELGAALQAFDGDDAIGAMVLAGSEKAFAAGADIAAMKDWNFLHVYRDDYITRDWEHIRNVRKPVIAAVSGYALGGRLRARDDVRHRDRRPGSQVRPAGDQPGHVPGRGRHAATAARASERRRPWT
jgi:enoyl-CoA hydratase/carnithine racemase